MNRPVPSTLSVRVPFAVRKRGGRKLVITPDGTTGGRGRASLIAWQALNAVRSASGRRFSRGFLIVTPGITIKDRLRVLQPGDPDSYYASRNLVPHDLLGVQTRSGHMLPQCERLLPS